MDELKTKKLNNIDSRNTFQKILELALKKENVAYCRFGDGDLQIAYGKNSGTHCSDKRQTQEMKQSFQIVHPNYLRALPLSHDSYGVDEPGMYIKYHRKKYCDVIFGHAIKFWGGDIYKDPIYSALAPIYLAKSDPKYLAFFLDRLTQCGNKVVLVGNEVNKIGELQNIFYNRISLFIGTPNKDAYLKIEEIWNKLTYYFDDHPDEYIIIIGFLGNSGRILCKKLWETKYHFAFFDFSSLMDLLCGGGCRRRRWMRMDDAKDVPIKKNLLNELQKRK
jgi:hypothetical protein